VHAGKDKLTENKLRLALVAVVDAVACVLFTEFYRLTYCVP